MFSQVALMFLALGTTFAAPAAKRNVQDADIERRNLLGAVGTLVTNQGGQASTLVSNVVGAASTGITQETGVISTLTSQLADPTWLTQGLGL